MKILTIVASSFFFTTVAIGGGLPEWIQKTPPEDAGYFYFVGFGEDQSLTNARKLADEDARRKIVQQFSGVYAEFTQRSKETTTNFESSKSSELQSDLIQIRGLKELESYRENEQHKEQVYILYGLPREEAEVLRAKASSRPEGILSLASISSIPAGATVKINGRKVGTTPLKIFLPFGRTELSLQLERHKVFRQSFHVERGKDLNVDYVLEALMGHVMVRCVPVEAEIEWNHQKILSNSVVDVPIGKYELKVTKEGSKTIIKTGVLRANKEKEFCLMLESLPRKEEPIRMLSVNKEGPPKVLSVEKNESPTKTIQVQVDEAYRFARIGKYKQALSLADAIEAIYPNQPIVHAIRAQVFVFTGNYSKAYKEQKNYIASGASGGSKHARAFLCYISGMDTQLGSGTTWREGYKECEAAVDESPMSALAQVGMGLHFEKNRKFVEARNSFSTAVSIDAHFKSEKRAFCHRNHYQHEIYFGGC